MNDIEILKRIARELPSYHWLYGRDNITHLFKAEAMVNGKKAFCKMYLHRTNIDGWCLGKYDNLLMGVFQHLASREVIEDEDL